MKIAIDVADLDCERIDGTRVYIQNVLKYLGELSPEDEFFLFHKSEYNKLLKPAKFTNYHDRSLGKGFWWTQFKFARAVKRLKPGVCWMPIQQIPFLPFGRSKKTKYVVTIHDLAFKFFPKHFPLIDKLKINFYTGIAVRRADKIIAISESTRQDLIRLYPRINADKIKVVYHGFDRGNFQKEFNEEEKVEFLKYWKLVDQMYLLYVGAIQPRKDLVTLVRAFEKLKKVKSNKHRDLKLLLVGEVAWKSESTIEAIEQSEFKNDIILTGRVDFKELAIFLRLAKIFVFPSLYEGFGIPLLEAMASETPVITADNSSLGEVGGDAVLKFESGSVEKLVEQVRRLLDDEELQQKIIAKGLKRVDKFSWEKCARETLEVIKSCE
jgi:glycosyltransferase involved in cell wall biosynthesis